MRKNRKIDVVRESRKLRWEKKKKKKKGRHAWVKEKYWDEKKKKKDRHGWERKLMKKNSVNFPNFPATQLLTSITSTNLMWNKDLTYYNNIVQCEIKYYLL